ncbi:cell adhesion protein [Lewinellaceae bacterium SD302]|nr:cell adhesion protein [Lewinellaceae bacterium SD302]
MRKLSSYFLMLMLCVTMVSFSSCDDDDDSNDPGTEEMTIAEIVADDDSFSTLLAALQQVNLDATLGQTGPFTVFAPTNQAFADAGIDLTTISDEALTEVLLYHVFSGQALTAGDGMIPEGATYLQTSSNNGPNNELLSLLVERSGSTVTLNGSINVSQADIIARNGVIHVINEVLMPLDVVGHALANSNFTSLTGALTDAGLVSALQADGPFTVFAPDNAAFAAAADVVAGLTDEQLSTVLTYHVVAGANVTESDIEAGDITTLSGQILQATSLDPVQVTDTQGNVVDVTFTDIQGTNGVVHVVENVLIPNL